MITDKQTNKQTNTREAKHSDYVAVYRCSEGINTSLEF